MLVTFEVMDDLRRFNPVMRTEGETAMTVYHFAAVIEKDEDGYYAFCPDLQGCYTSGATFEEARDHLADAIRLHVEDRLASGEAITSPESVNLTTIEFPV